MVNKVTSYYTTDMSMRDIWSNNIKRILAYDKLSLDLVIEFHSGAIYLYKGVPNGLYDGMMSAPSHGVFFYENIRQRFTYKRLNATQAQKYQQKANPIYSVFPELSKLDKLDRDEQELTKAYEAGTIELNAYQAGLDKIEVQKDKLLAKLRKDGYFNDYDELIADALESKDYSKWELFYKNSILWLGRFIAGSKPIIEALLLLCWWVIQFGVAMIIFIVSLAGGLNKGGRR